MTRTTRRPTPQRAAWVHMRGFLEFLGVAWLSLLTFVIVALLALHRFEVFAGFRDDVGSAWAGASNLAVWALAGIAGYLGYFGVPVQVAYGRTRAQAMREIGLVLAGLIVAVMLLILAGFAVEAVVYRALDWPLAVRPHRAFDSRFDVLGIAIDYLPSLVLWSAAAALVGACAYRFGARGWLSLAPVVPFSVLVELVVRADEGASVVAWPPDAGLVAVAVRCAALVVAVALLLLAAWSVLRDVPVRNA